MLSLKQTQRMPAFVLTILVLAALPALCDDSGQVVDTQHPREIGHTQQQPQVAACDVCHRCERPTREDPCMVDCPRYESQFHSQLNPDAGPDVVVIDQLADLYEPIVFAHRLHAEMSEMTGGCENCHHYSEDSGSIPACRECHDESRNRVDLKRPSLKGAYHRQCMGCHIDWSHENACEFCHEQADHAAAHASSDSTDIVGIPHPLISAQRTFNYQTSHQEGPVVTFHHEDHVEKFGLNCVDCHRGDSCSRCHDTQPETVKRVDHVTTCCNCHGERNCSFCHNDEAQPEFEHGSSTGWPLAPYHLDAKCQTCHGKPDAFRTPSARCASCHIHWGEGSFNHAVTGLVLDENHEDIDCDSCHPDLDVKQTPVCEDCHDEPMYPRQLPGRRR